MHKRMLRWCNPVRHCVVVFRFNYFLFSFSAEGANFHFILINHMPRSKIVCCEENLAPCRRRRRRRERRMAPPTPPSPPPPPVATHSTCSTLAVARPDKRAPGRICSLREPPRCVHQQYEPPPTTALQPRALPLRRRPWPSVLPMKRRRSRRRICCSSL